MNQKKNLSMKEIAELCNVSVATVSRVINQNGRFSKETEEKVRAVIKEYGYKTNMVAKSLRMRQSKSIGVIVPDIKNEFFSSIVLEIENFFFSEGYSVFICNTNNEEEKEQEYLKSLDAKNVDGLIYISGNEDLSLHSLHRNIPIVCIDRKPNIDENIAIVESDNYVGGYIAAEKLINEGCKNILLIRSRKDLSTIRLRYKGYADALKKGNLKVRDELIIDLTYTTFEEAKVAVDKFIKEGITFDGVFATNDWLALGALIAMRENNISVPQDVKIIGFDNISISKYSYPSITTIDQNKKKLGEEAANALLNFINKEETRAKLDIVIPVKLIERETT
ncbi:LacI family DNA-binding transcriptional regulator [Bacillus sp. FJAT-50079]|uniref:LacI family DNA-binding transcriptional regulator n=1 Tax=Bacillus sp. FJAT-50079 TaxID=2833577 RepID=UPI001BC98BC3|nr:LacI family DNA-binding transcriptional regulator [Bacillus sp. FJAT-50079]MBS4210118.1 LacI family DNA-binding transcriptional regulator [Bacillus sp. FJAT-50079]